MAKPHIPGQLGLFKPQSDWQAPTAPPDLRGCRLVALDTENKDDGLSLNKGPGWALGMGYICGVAWAAGDETGYLPIRHPDTDCLNPGVVLRWVEDLFRSGTRVVFHNSPYDLGWFWSQGVAPPDGAAQLEDTLAMSVMLDETHRYPETYSLDDCCRRAGVPGKDQELLRDAVRAYGGDPAHPAAHLWRLPARYAAPYAEQDARATLALARQSLPALEAQGLMEAYRTEMELVPMVVAMRRRGIRLDTERALRTAEEFRRRRDQALAELSSQVQQGRPVTMDDVRSPQWLERIHKAENIQFPKTEKTERGSFSKDWMERHPHWLPQTITKAIQWEGAATKFIETYLLGFSHRGRVHAEVHQFLSEGGGTRSHRFSYSEPPLQQMPSPDKDPRGSDGKIDMSLATGTLIRDCFLPERGELWGSADYSGQEVRLAVHFAHLCKANKADEMVARFLDNPRSDFHQMVADMTGLPRWQAKIINFGLMYGKGVASLAEDLKVSLDEAKAILTQYHERMPFVKSLEETCKRLGAERGYIRLVDGARMRYTQWEGGWVDGDLRRAALAAKKRMEPCSREEAVERQADPDHPWARTRLRRADTRKSLNNLVQGSAARQTKLAMRGMWREGILPLIQVHDELGYSTGDERVARRVEEIMRDAVKLKVPVVVDNEFGTTWGRAKKSWSEANAALVAGDL